MQNRSIDVGVYYFPGYHADERISRWHGQHWTEWALAKDARPRFEGHAQPKVPLWGYEDESTPAAMQKRARLAAEHGITHFIFDWYFYEGEPFLNRCLDDGFLRGSEPPAVKFSLMWANHDWLNIQPARLDSKHPVMLKGAVTPRMFHSITEHVIERYLTSPHYYRLNRGAYFSFFDLAMLVQGLGGVRSTRVALDAFRERTQRAGAGELHLNCIHALASSRIGLKTYTGPELLHELGFDSWTVYNWPNILTDQQFPTMPYALARDQAMEFMAKAWDRCSVPFHPNVTMGWDASPRCCQTDAFEQRDYPFSTVYVDNTPAEFRKALIAARDLLLNRPASQQHVGINAWNEWTEGSYLEPDTVHGLSYLKAVRDVFGNAR